MAPTPPLWRQLFDVAERAVTPRLESLVRTGHFARAAALTTEAQAFARAQAAGISARLWHVVNLPAGTDVARLRAQVGALDREVRRLTLKLEQQRSAPAAPPDGGATEKEIPDAGRTQPADRARPGPPRRRAQRPARP